MSVVTTISPPPRLVTTIAAPDPQGATTTVIGTLATAFGATYGPRVVSTVRDGFRGAPGPAGSDVSTYTAGAVVNGHKLLGITSDGLVVHADVTDPDAAFLYVGMSEAAAGVGSTLTARRVGLMTFDGWAWEDGLVYLGPNGDPTQTLPDTAASAFAVGFGSGPFLYLNPQLPIFPPL